MVCVGKEERPLWCPVEYEFPPDFCYTCGIIGHTDKVSEVELKRGEAQQFSKKLLYESRRRKDWSKVVVGVLGVIVLPQAGGVLEEVGEVVLLALARIVVQADREVMPHHGEEVRAILVS